MLPSSLLLNRIVTSSKIWIIFDINAVASTTTQASSYKVSNSSITEIDNNIVLWTFPWEPNHNHFIKSWFSCNWKVYFHVVFPTVSPTTWFLYYISKDWTTWKYMTWSSLEDKYFSDWISIYSATTSWWDKTIKKWNHNISNDNLDLVSTITLSLWWFLNIECFDFQTDAFIWTYVDGSNHFHIYRINKITWVYTHVIDMWAQSVNVAYRIISWEWKTLLLDYHFFASPKYKIYKKEYFWWTDIWSQSLSDSFRIFWFMKNENKFYSEEWSSLVYRNYDNGSIIYTWATISPSWTDSSDISNWTWNTFIALKWLSLFIVDVKWWITIKWEINPFDLYNITRCILI